MFHFHDLSEPAGYLIIPQSARAILYVGLEMKNCPAIFFMPGPCKAGEFLHEILGFPHHHARQRAASEPVIELLIPADIPAVEKGYVEFNIISMKFSAFGQSPGCGADAKVQIPECLAQWGDDSPAQNFFAAFFFV